MASSLFEQLEINKRTQNALNDQLVILQIIEKDLREKIIAQMKEEGIVTRKSDRFTFSLVVRNDLKIVDDMTVRQYLRSRGRLEECLRLDLPAVKALAKIDQIPGIEPTSMEILMMREVKERVDRIEPEESQANFNKRVREAHATS